MDQGRPTVRLFVLTASAAAAPLALALVALGQTDLVNRLGAGTSLLVFVLVTLAWSAVVTVIGARGISGEVAAMLDLARRGRTTPGGAGSDGDSSIGSTGGAYDRLALVLEERNRQIGELAAAVRAVPVGDDVRGVAWATVRTAISVTRDPTWNLAVLRSPEPGALPIGTYADHGGHGDPEPLGEVALWAATMAPDQPGVEAVRHGIGPWGAFTVVDVAAGDDLRAILMAPWEGRAAPVGPERELLSLLGQNAAIGLEHALLIERLRSQTDELNRMAAVQSDFLRGVTHDLQTPLTSIRALASELKERPGLPEAARSDLEMIGHQADRLRRMVAQLLVASRLEAGVVQPNQEVFRLEPIVRRTWAALRAGRPFTLETSGVPHLTVGDADRLEQVLWALLDNAVKYSPSGSPVRVFVYGTGHEGPLHSRIEIHDDGSGMDPETQGHAFEQFYRSDQARRLAPDGSGVGLYAARGLVEAMGGTIQLSSRLGSGTTVTIDLPAEPVEEANAEPREPTPARS